MARAIALWIQERLAASLPRGSESPERQAEALLRTAWIQANSNLLWFHKIAPDGKSLETDLTRATDEMMRAIESMDVVEQEDPETGVIQRRIKFKLKPSGPAMALLASALGMERRQVLVTGKQQVQIQVSYRDKSEIAKRLEPDVVVEGPGGRGTPVITVEGEPYGEREHVCQVPHARTRTLPLGEPGVVDAEVVDVVEGEIISQREPLQIPSKSAQSTG